MVVIGLRPRDMRSMAIVGLSCESFVLEFTTPLPLISLASPYLITWDNCIVTGKSINILISDTGANTPQLNSPRYRSNFLIPDSPVITIISPVCTKLYDNGIHEFRQFAKIKSAFKSRRTGIRRFMKTKHFNSFIFDSMCMMSHFSFVSLFFLMILSTFDSHFKNCLKF